MKLSILWSFGLKTPVHAPKLGFWGISPSKWGAISTKPPISTKPAGPGNGSIGVLIMSVSSIVPEKSRENKKKIVTRKKKKYDTFLAVFASLYNGRDMVVCNCFDIYMFILSSTALSA